MPLIKQNEPMPKRNTIILIHGEPGLGKTSLFNTCNGLLLDFEDGSRRSHARKDTFLVDRAKGWQEIINEENAGTFKGYKTIGIDTPKAMLDDFMMQFVKDKDPKIAYNMLKVYGAIGDEAKAFYNRLRGNDADIVNMVHTVSDKDGDKFIKTPDVTGQSLQLLKRVSDQIGYMYSENGQRVLDFRIQDGIVTKDTAGLGKLVVPPVDHPSYEGWLQREVIDKVKERMDRLDAEQLKALDFIAEWRNSIDAVTPGEDVSRFAGELGETMKGISDIKEEHLKKQLRAYFSSHLKKIGWKWDGDKKAFVAIESVSQPFITAEVPASEVKDDLFAG